MNEKQQLIQAFKRLDFGALENLLDDNRSYMDVSKDLFLSTFKENIDKSKNLNSYEKVIDGTCCSCNKGCKTYKFMAKGFPSLNLFFEEKNEKVTDIYLCNALNVEIPDENYGDIDFRFYEEEKVNFTPTSEYLVILQRIEKAVADFNKLKSMGLVPVQEVVHWYNVIENLAKKLNLNDPFANIKYKAFIHIDNLYSEVSFLVHNCNNNQLAQDALKEYYDLNKEDEKMIVRWLLNQKKIYFFSLQKTDNWEKTGTFILETEPNLIIDCSNYLDSFLFNEIYTNLKNEIMKKYEPTEEHFIQNGGSVENSLENFLRLHNKYLDLIN